MKEIRFYKASKTEKEREYIQQALESHSSLMIDKLENAIKDFYGTRHAISTNNNSTAHHLALCAMDIKRGDKIICSVNGFPGVAHAVRHFDAEPIFVDINEDDFNIDPQSLLEVLEQHNHKKLKGIFVNHIGGQSSAMDEIYDIAEKFKVEVFDDASKSIGLTYKNQKIGNIKSKLSCFQISSQLHNPVATAGFIVTNDDELATNARLLRNYGIIKGMDKNGSLGYIYDVTNIGLRYDLTGINAAYALAHFEENSKFVKRRLEIAKIYDEELKNCPHISIPFKNRDHIYNQYIIKIDKNRDSFAKELLDLGIHSSLHYVPIHLLTYYKNKYALKVNAFPKALKIYQQTLSLPIYNALSDDDVYYICEQVINIAKSRV